MKPERSKLARLAIAYYVKFERHVPAPALRLLNAGDLAAILQDSLATGVPISEGEFGWFKPPEYRLGGCILRDETPNEASHTNEPDRGKPR